MASKSYLFLIIVYSLVFVGSSDLGFDDQDMIVVNEEGGGGTPISSLPCVQKLLPCQPYLTSPNTPPASCCVPLREMLVKESVCLCAVFNNPSIMKSLNVTKNEALKFPEHCGAKANLALCDTADTPTGSPTTPTSSNSSTQGSSPSTNKAAKRISLHDGSAIISLFFVLIISAF